MTESAERFEVYRLGSWRAVAPEEIGWGELYRHYKDGVRLRRGDQILFAGPVNPPGPVDTSGVLAEADSQGRADADDPCDDDPCDDEPIGDCIGIVCDHARSGQVSGYGKVRFLKCALKNKAIMELKVCPQMKWRRNWKGEI
jgi:hypothetical protein